MNWRVVVHPEVEHDVAEAVAWYESKDEGVGERFRKEVVAVFDALSV